jgi:hypothetical protein
MLSQAKIKTKVKIKTMNHHVRVQTMSTTRRYMTMITMMMIRTGRTLEPHSIILRPKTVTSIKVNRVDKEKITIHMGILTTIVGKLKMMMTMICGDVNWRL